jgi:hypothetical protein
LDEFFERAARGDSMHICSFGYVLDAVSTVLDEVAEDGLFGGGEIVESGRHSGRLGEFGVIFVVLGLDTTPRSGVWVLVGGVTCYPYLFVGRLPTTECSMVDVTIEADEIVQRKADARGRVTLGAEYGDADVTVAVVRGDGDDEHDENSDGAEPQTAD